MERATHLCLPKESFAWLANLFFSGNEFISADSSHRGRLFWPPKSFDEFSPNFYLDQLVGWFLLVYFPCGKFLASRQSMERIV
jgi:hypothetical protein